MKNKKRYIIHIAVTVALGGFILGFDASVISGALKFVEKEFALNKIELGWLVSSITLTAALGTLIAGPLSDKLGRRRVLKFAAVLFAVSALGSALAPTFFILIAARLIGGLAVGAALIIAPVYIAEVSPPENRGQLVSFNQLNIVIGISLAFFTNYGILLLGQSDTSWAQALKFDLWNWRWMLGLEVLPALGYFIGLNFIPRSPRWLAMQGKEGEARQIMVQFTTEADAKTQIDTIKKSLSKTGAANEKKATITDLFKPKMRLVLTIGLVVAVFQMITGINSVLFYAPMIFEQTGIGTDASFIQAILVGLTNLVATIIAMAIIDRLGRKPLLIFGMGGMAICLLLLAYGFGSASYTLTEDSITGLPNEIEPAMLAPLKGKVFETDLEFKTALADTLGQVVTATYESELISAAADIDTALILLCILGFVASFAVSIGPVMWVLFSELFPNNIRGIAISFVGLVNLGMGFLVQLVFPWELANFGNALTFLIYGIMAVIGLAFILWKVPETKGKSLEELEALLVK